MSESPIIIEKVYPVTVEKVWKAITDKNEMKKWYFDIPFFEPLLGFEFSFIGEGKQGEQYVHLCKIIEVVKPQKLSHSWSYQGFPGYSLVTFELFAEAGNTRLRLMHQGLETFPNENGAFAKENFVQGWEYIIGKSLKDYFHSDKI